MGELDPSDGADLWWDIAAHKAAAEEVEDRLLRDGFPFLERFATRDLVLENWRWLIDRDMTFSSAIRITAAALLHARGQEDSARALLEEQGAEPQHNPSHRDYLQNLAEQWALGRLDFDRESSASVEP